MEDKVAAGALGETAPLKTKPRYRRASCKRLHLSINSRWDKCSLCGIFIDYPEQPI